MNGARIVWELFRRASRAHRGRRRLTALAIAWGTVSIVLMLAFGEGMRDQLNTGLNALGTDVVIMWPVKTSKPFQGMPEGRPVRLRPDDIEVLAREARSIAWASGEIVNWRISLTAGRVTRTVRVTAVHSGFAGRRRQTPQAGGRFLNALDQAERRRVIFLGDRLKQSLFGERDAVGEAVLVDGVAYTVVGVRHPEAQTMMVSGPDADAAYLPMSTYRYQFGTDVLTMLLVKPVGTAHTAQAIREVYELLGRKHRFDPSDEAAIFVLDPVKILGPIMTGILIIELLLGLVGAVTLAVAGVGVANVMVATVKQRAREIGIQMALGARPLWITAPILLDALLQTCAGGGLGVALSLGLMRITSLIPVEADSPAKFLTASTFSPALGVATAGLLGAIGFIAGLFPARNAVRIQPAEVLRCE